MQTNSTIKAVIFDWAGTTLDYGCMAPASVFMKIFNEASIDLTIEQARGPMGSHKKVHIEILLKLPEVQAQWQRKFGKTPDESDVMMLFNKFVPLQIACLKEHSEMIPGVVETITKLKDAGIKIGSTTGYTRAMMEIVAPEAKKQGYVPDFLVCADEVPAGRPEPWMCLRNAEHLRAYPLHQCVKVGDTVVDIQEGLNAGMWSVGLTLCGNEVGLTQAHVQKLSATEREKLVSKAEQKLKSAGAHYLISSVVELPAVLKDIESKIAQGLKP